MKIQPLIDRLRTKLPTGTWGSPVRVFGVAELERAIRGDHKPSMPALYVSYGGSTASVDVDRNSSLTLQTVVETLDLYVLLDNKKANDLTGLDAQEQVHDIRNAILGILLYFNLDIDDSLSYGIDPQELKFTGDSMYKVDAERYFHKFSFEHDFNISNAFQGIGTSNPETLDDLIKIAGTIEPIEFDTDSQPALSFELDNLDA